MSEHIVENNPQKEFMLALGGVGLFLAIVLLIGVSAFLRPAGQHIAPEAPVEEAAAAPVEADAAVAPAAPADSSAAPVAAEPATATAPAAADKAATDAAAPAEKADGNADKTATAQ